MVQLKRRYEIVVIGTSAGGLHAVTTLMSVLPSDFSVPLVLCQHIPAQGTARLDRALRLPPPFQAREAEEKENLAPFTLLIAPPAYHLLVERDSSLSLSTEEAVQFARPSIDVLFESAAVALGPAVIGILLTGANRDGAQGLKEIRDRGGCTIVQDPTSAAVPTMPQAALELAAADYVLPLREMGELLARLARKQVFESDG